MSVQDLPSDPETTPEPDERIMRRLVRALDYSKGFWLGFAKSNTPAQRRRLAALCKDLLEPLKIRVLEIELNEPITDLLPILRERLAQEGAANDEEKATQPKLAIFVHGLECSIPSREAYPPLLSALNLKRELFRQEVPHPLLLWLPDYALTALARKAPDFWAWRSGLYEFAPEREAAEQSLGVLLGEEIHITESLSEQVKRERLVMLKGLLDDYRELGNSLHEQEARANLLTEIGMVHGMLGEWSEAKPAFQETLTVARNLRDEWSEAGALHNLGRVADEEGDGETARRFYDESLEIKKRLGNESGASITLNNLGMLAQEQGELEEAHRLFSASLEISKGISDQHNVAGTLHNLGRLAQEQGELEEAHRLFSASLEISKSISDQATSAISLCALGTLAAGRGDKVEAARLLREALSVFERLGSPHTEYARRSLSVVETDEDVSA